MSGLDAAFIDMQSGFGAFGKAWSDLANDARIVLISDDLTLPAGSGVSERVTFGAVGLDAAPFSSETVAASLHALAEGAKTLFVVDMAWGWKTPAAAANFDVWGGAVWEAVGCGALSGVAL